MTGSIYTPRRQLCTAIVGLLLFFLVLELRPGLFSATRESLASEELRPQSTMAVVTVPGSQSISINSAKAISGATILSGAAIATPNEVSATVVIGSVGTLDIAPSTTLKTEFDQSGNVKVTLTQGCAIMRARKDVVGRIVTPDGTAAKTDSRETKPLKVCFPQGIGAGPEIEQNEAGGLLHLAGVAAVAVIGGRVRSSIAIGLDDRGSNPGPSTP
jgi:hypothetical protein